MNRNQLVRALEAALAVLREPEDDPPVVIEPASEILDVEGAAKLLHLHPKLVERKARAKEIPAHRLPGTRNWRFMRADLIAWATQAKAS